MHERSTVGRRGLRLVGALAFLTGLLAIALCAGAAAKGSAAVTQTARSPSPKPTITSDTAHDLSPPLRVLAANRVAPDAEDPADEPDEGPTPGADTGYSGDGALQSALLPATIPSTEQNFEGLSNEPNFNFFGFRVNPPDPNGEVGPNNYVEMVNLTFAVYDKFTDRWILSQFTTSGMNADGSFNGLPFYNCVAVSQTGDPTGAYYRYAFITSQAGSTSTFFPDYPKYGVWTDSYVLTSRDFGSQDEYGISVYGLEKNKMVNGEPARAVHFFLDGNDPDVLPLVGDGLLPADIDGKQKPKTDTAAPIVGTQDDGAGYGATFDALNIWDLTVKWNSAASSTLTLKTQLPTAAFDSIFPCAPTSRDCLPQPGIVNPAQYLDILSYRQRPTFRLAYRNFKSYEALVTNQSVEATPGVAGARWYEIRRTGTTYSLFQQGTYAPGDGVHRWMGSIAMDKKGDMGLGYSVVNGTTVYPGIRYTGRLAGDPLGQMTQGEGTAIAGSGVQTSTRSRWGDYTSMNIDPVDDCTFWYVNEYYTAAGHASSPAGWQPRIASFKLPGC